QRSAAGKAHAARYERERAGLGGVLKNYRWITLLWMLPLWLAQSAARTVYLLLARRFEDALEMVRAMWWNVRHLGRTWAGRHRGQRARRASDHQIRRFMAPPGEHTRRLMISLSEWARTGQGEAPDDEPQGLPGSRLIGRFAAAHPVLVAWVLAAVVAAVSYRHLVGVHLAGGAVAAVPSSATRLFHELLSRVPAPGLRRKQRRQPRARVARARRRRGAGQHRAVAEDAAVRAPRGRRGRGGARHVAPHRPARSRSPRGRRLRARAGDHVGVLGRADPGARLPGRP